MKYLVLIFTLLCYTETVSGREEDIFEYDDFLDPRVMGARINSDNKFIFTGEFSYWDIAAGQIWNYQNRTMITQQDPSFFTLGYYKYKNDKQFNGRLSYFEDKEGIPRYRGKIEYSKYVAKDSRSNPGEKNVFRNTISLVIDEARNEDAEYEVVITAEVKSRPLPLLKAPLQGGISGSWRRAQSDDIYRVMWNSSSCLFIGCEGDDKLLLTGSLWIGYEKSDFGSRIIPLRGKLDLQYRISSRSSVNLIYAPAYQSDGADFEDDYNSEVALVVNYMFDLDY